MLAAAVAAACVLALGVPPASASAVFSPPSPASPLPSPGWRAVPLPDVGNGSLNDLSALGRLCRCRSASLVRSVRP
jgi:hypothetical protein